uniref:Uncharacterized protein n=1 Tax=Physcomitrium patens TaxID=3218 RepID=A0A7I4AEY7_PHYPA
MGGEVKHLVGHESPNEDQVPTTFELKEYGYLALARGLGSGLYEAAGGLSNQASGGLEILVVQNGELESGIEDDVGGLRQSSMDLEPYTLDISAIKEAKCFGTLLPNINAGFPPFSSDLTDSGPSWLFRGLLPVDSVGGNIDTLGKLCLSFGFFNVLQDIAIGIVKAYDAEDALHLFLKDAEDEQLRKEAMAAVLPTSEFAVLG